MHCFFVDPDTLVYMMPALALHCNTCGDKHALENTRDTRRETDSLTVKVQLKAAKPTRHIIYGLGTSAVQHLCNYCSTKLKNLTGLLEYQAAGGAPGQPIWSSTTPRLSITCRTVGAQCRCHLVVGGPAARLTAIHRRKGNPPEAVPRVQARDERCMLAAPRAPVLARIRPLLICIRSYSVELPPSAPRRRARGAQCLGVL